MQFLSPDLAIDSAQGKPFYVCSYFSVAVSRYDLAMFASHVFANGSQL